MSRAYVNVSTNPITSVGQKKKDFWAQVKQAYEELYISENVQEEEGKVDRDQEALQNRFKRHIQSMSTYSTSISGK